MPKKCLPVLHDRAPAAEPDRTPVRPSQSTKWRALSLVLIHVVAALHLAHWLATGSTVTPVEPSEAMAFSKASIVNAGLIFFALMILSTAVFGRYFCGWACHLVALQDLCRALLIKLGIRPKPLRSRLLAWVPAGAFAYMFLWPVAYRAWIGDSFAIAGYEMTTAEFWSTFPGWVVGALTFLTCGFVAVYFLGAKGFCTYACPYGAIFAAADRVAPLRIRVTDACQHCGHCTAVCSSNVRVHEEVRDWGMVISPGCMKCHDCVSVCPTGALYAGFGQIPLFAKPRVAAPAPRRPAWSLWQELLLGAAFLAALFTFRGLYGAVPFLMALGVAGIFAFLALLAERLFREHDVALQGSWLKAGGKLTTRGRVAAACLALLAGFWVHSAAHRVLLARADAAYAALAPLRHAVEAAVSAPAPNSEEQEQVERAAHLAAAVDRWGLLPTFGLAGKRAWIAFFGGSMHQAEVLANSAAERRELVHEMRFLAARAAQSRGDLRSAIRSYEQAILERPELPSAYLHAGIALAEAGDLRAAETFFDRGRSHVPASPELVYNAGLVRALQGRPREAVDLFQQALALRPSYLEARENLAGMLASLGLYEESALYYRTALEQNPGDASTHALFARVLAAQGRNAEAIAELERALAIEPGLDEAHRLLTELQAN